MSESVVWNPGVFSGTVANTSSLVIVREGVSE